MRKVKQFVFRVRGWMRELEERAETKILPHASCFASPANEKRLDTASREMASYVHAYFQFPYQDLTEYMYSTS